MVEKFDADRARERREAPRQRDVGVARFGRARWMVVREQDAMRADVEGPPEQEAQVRLDLPGDTDRDTVVGKIAPVGRDEGRVQTLDRRMADAQAKIVAIGRVVRRDGRPADPLVEPRGDETACGDQPVGEVRIVGKRGAKLVARGGEGASEPSEMGDQPIGRGSRPPPGEGLEKVRQDRYGPRCFRRLAWKTSPPVMIARMM